MFEPSLSHPKLQPLPHASKTTMSGSQRQARAQHPPPLVPRVCCLSAPPPRGGKPFACAKTLLTVGGLAEGRQCERPTRPLPGLRIPRHVQGESESKRRQLIHKCRSDRNYLGCCCRRCGWCWFCCLCFHLTHQRVIIKISSATPISPTAV